MKRSTATRRRVLKDFSWDAVCLKIATLLEECAR